MVNDDFKFVDSFGDVVLFFFSIKSRLSLLATQFLWNAHSISKKIKNLVKSEKNKNKTDIVAMKYLPRFSLNQTEMIKKKTEKKK